jgi:hypothetical protein
MQRNLTRRLFGLAALVSVALFGLSNAAQAISIGTLNVGTPYADVIESPGPTFSQDYDFHLDDHSQLTVLAAAQSQQSSNFSVDALTISLFDAANTLIATDSAVPLASFDSFGQSGVSLAAGDYVIRVFGDVTPGFNAFVNVAIAANDFAVAPIPGALVMLLTALGGLGGAGVMRRYRATAQRTALPA